MNEIANMMEVIKAPSRPVNEVLAETEKKAEQTKEEKELAKLKEKVAKEKAAQAKRDEELQKKIDQKVEFRDGRKV